MSCRLAAQVLSPLSEGGTTRLSVSEDEGGLPGGPPSTRWLCSPANPRLRLERLGLQDLVGGGANGGDSPCRLDGIPELLR